MLKTNSNTILEDKTQCLSVDDFSMIFCNISCFDVLRMSQVNKRLRSMAVDYASDTLESMQSICKSSFISFAEGALCMLILSNVCGRQLVPIPRMFRERIYNSMSDFTGYCYELTPVFPLHPHWAVFHFTDQAFSLFYFVVGGLSSLFSKAISLSLGKSHLCLRMHNEADLIAIDILRLCVNLGEHSYFSNRDWVSSHFRNSKFITVSIVQHALGVWIRTHPLEKGVTGLLKRWSE